jgi:hypothetical protein
MLLDCTKLSFMKDDLASVKLSQIGWLLLESSCHSVRNARPYEEAMCRCSGQRLLLKVMCELCVSEKVFERTPATICHLSMGRECCYFPSSFSLAKYH